MVEQIQEMDISCFKSWAPDYWPLKNYMCKHLSSHAVVVQETPTAPNQTVDK